MERKRTRRTSLGPAVRASRRPTTRAETSSLDLLAEKIATAAPKPKNRYWEFLNSSFVLWFLTAVLITLTGAYFSTVQRCYSEGEAVSESYAHLTREIFNRSRHMAKAVEKAESIQAIREAAKSIPYTYSELEGRTDFEMGREIRRLSERINRSATAGFDLGLKPDGYRMQDWFRFRPALSGKVDDTITDEELPQLKKLIVIAWQYEQQRFGADFVSVIRPACGAGNVFNMVFGGSRSVVAATSWAFGIKPQPGFVRLDF